MDLLPGGSAPGRIRRTSGHATADSNGGSFGSFSNDDGEGRAVPLLASVGIAVAIPVRAPGAHPSALLRGRTKWSCVGGVSTGAIASAIVAVAVTLALALALAVARTRTRRRRRGQGGRQRR